MDKLKQLYVSVYDTNINRYKNTGRLNECIEYKKHTYMMPLDLYNIINKTNDSVEIIKTFNTETDKMFINILNTLLDNFNYENRIHLGLTKFEYKIYVDNFNDLNKIKIKYKNKSIKVFKLNNNKYDIYEFKTYKEYENFINNNYNIDKLYNYCITNYVNNISLSITTTINKDKTVNTLDNIINKLYKIYEINNVYKNKPIILEINNKIKECYYLKENVNIDEYINYIKKDIKLILQNDQ